jgi:Homing endonuclease associated repeat/Sigma-70, region 4
MNAPLPQQTSADGVSSIRRGMPTNGPGINHDPTLDPRLTHMVALRQAGETLQQIADRYTVSRERVRQIIKPANIDMADVRTRRRQIADAAAQEQAGAILEEWANGTTPADIARVRGLPGSIVRTVCSRASEAQITRRLTVQVRSRDISAKRYSDEDLFAAIRQVARTLGRTPSSGDYRLLAKEFGLPSGVLIGKRIGWRVALLGAGLVPRGDTHGGYKRKWTRAVCLAAVEGVARDLGRVPSYAEYSQAAMYRVDRPSGPTVRNRVGGWIEVRRHLVEGARYDRPT